MTKFNANGILKSEFLYNIVKEREMWDFREILLWFGLLVTKETADFIFWGLVFFVLVGPVALFKISRYVYLTLKRRANKFWLANLYKYIEENRTAVNPDLEQNKIKK